jgi:hypothetical protein
MNFKFSSFRIMIVTSYVTITVLLSAYSAALISFMTVQDIKLPFTTFEGLLQHGEYQLATVQGTVHISYFNVRTDVPPLMSFAISTTVRFYLRLAHWYNACV